jgi:hypothetical protein
LSRESVTRFLTRSWLAARRTSVITRGNSRVSSVRLTSLVKIAHRTNEGQLKREAGGNRRIFREEGGLGREPEAWAGCLEAGSFWGIDALGRPVLPFGRVEYLDLKLAWLNSEAREPRW